MSKVVTIPKDRNPFVVIVNGVKHSYPAGVSTEVPDEVADVIEKYVGAKPKPDPNAGINFGGTQSDWNQTDSSAADFIKNKPFGEVVTEIIPETEIVGEDVGDGIYATPFNATSFQGMEETLIVTFDGVEYICSNVGSPLGLTIFGNMGLVGEMDTGEPFMIDPLGALSGEPIIAVADAERHTIGIQSTLIEKLDGKYVTNYFSFYMSADFGDNPYIYTDISLSNKATIVDLNDAATTQVIQVYAVIGSMICIALSPLFVSLIEGCIEVRNWKSIGEEHIRLYTAEHTP